MRYRSYGLATPKRVVMYCFYVILVVWFLSTVVLGYQFLMKNSKTTTKKGGTFVEAIFNEVSYLPYLKNDGQSMFYQSFLFDSCLDYNRVNAQGLSGSFCSLSTSDHQTYTVRLGGSEKRRSDGKSISLDDLFFTYDQILVKNIWDIKSLAAYKEVKVEQKSDHLLVTFPTSTTDNDYFFTYYLLPSHVLVNADINKYKSIFAANPITSGCGKIAPKTSDTQSLVFDLTKCEDTNFAYYQIKNYDGFEKLSKSVVEDNNYLVDTYAYQSSLPGYQRLNVVRSQLLTLFFNTKSSKMKVRFRRAFGGLINANMYKGEYRNYLKKYTDPLLAQFVSDGSNIKEFLNRLNQPEEGAAAQDLWDSGVSALPKSLAINGVERKFVFHLAKPANNIFNLEIKFSNQFENIKVSDANKNVYTPKNYKKFDKKIVYPLEFGKNLKEGLNKYTIQGTIKGKTYTIGYIDLYLLGATNQQAGAVTGTNSDLNDKVKIVYYNNLESNFAINQIRDILTKYSVLDYFLFEQVSTPEDLEGKLVRGDYDILLNTINIGLKKGVLKILTTDDPLINPSKYTNPNLTQLFKQYTKAANKSEFTSQINQLFGNDMPFVILGYPYDFVGIKENLIGTGNVSTGAELHEYNRRNYLYKNAVLMQSVIIDFSKLGNLRDFWSTIKLDSGLEKVLSSLRSSGEEKEVSVQSGTGDQGVQEAEVLPHQQPNPENPSDPFNGLISPAG
ncbi:hypothetical protein HXK74_00065 [Candidatus Gracilibacteria bacterium]|nr:hypothetical protein [Candidatus Gracilibacteria bacterium]